MIAGVELRDGSTRDLRTGFELSARARHEEARRSGLMAEGPELDDTELQARWLRERELVEFVSAQPGSAHVAEVDGEPVGLARVTTFGPMDELTGLAVDPAYVEHGVGRALLERCWPRPPTPQRARLVVTVGTPADLSLYLRSGLMPVGGRWHVRHRARDYLERRAREGVDDSGPAVHLAEPEHAVAEWRRLEPAALGYARPPLHDFFARTRVCLACLRDDGSAHGLCWVSPEGDIGPAVGEEPEDLVPVVLAALDRVAGSHEPEELGLYVTTESWWLLDRLRRLGFKVHWPGWVLCSTPLPGLDRYLPTRPPHVL